MQETSRHTPTQAARLEAFPGMFWLADFGSPQPLPQETRRATSEVAGNDLGSGGREPPVRRQDLVAAGASRASNFPRFSVLSFLRGGLSRSRINFSRSQGEALGVQSFWQKLCVAVGGELALPYRPTPEAELPRSLACRSPNFGTRRIKTRSCFLHSQFAAGKIFCAEHHLPGMPRNNYIFIDFENKPRLDIDLDRIANKPVKVTLVLGKLQTRLPTALVKQVHRYASQVELIETGQIGKNALDRVLILHVGATRQVDPAGYFHIVSDDKGFGTLIAYLNENGTRAAQRASLNEIPVLMNLPERVQRMTVNFKATPNSLPKKRKTLEPQIQACFGKALSPEEVEDTIRALVAAKVIAFSENEDVIYKI